MNNIKVLGIGQGKLVPSYRYRLKEVLIEFQKVNVDLCLFESTVSSYPSESILKRISWLAKLFFSRIPLIIKQNDYDVIILQREIISTLYTIERFFNKPFILDVDDAIHLNQRFESIDKLAKKAVAIVVCNDFLAEYYHQFNKNVYVIPTPINIDKYKYKHKSIEQKNIFVIGWIGTSSNFSSLKLIEKAVNKFLELYSNSTLKIVSNKDPNFQIIPKHRYIFKEWSEHEDVEDIQSFDIGIMPLINNKHSQGKCAFKMLQYMACNIPVVSSCLPMNEKIIKNSNCGYCIHGYEDEWVSAFLKLYKNEDLRKEFGKNGRRIIEKRFSTKIYARLYCEILKKIKNKE